MITEDDFDNIINGTKTEVKEELKINDFNELTTKDEYNKVIKLCQNKIENCNDTIEGIIRHAGFLKIRRYFEEKIK